MAAVGELGIQEQLCVQMEAPRALEDPEEIRAPGPRAAGAVARGSDVPRPQGDALWRRFKAAHDDVWARCEAHFAAEAENRAENLAQKIALCERAEALAGSTTGSDGRGDQAAAGRVENGRTGLGLRENGLGAVPRGVRSVLHAAP